jgi:hypothetical protein
MERLVEVGHILVAAVDGEGVLDQVVGADGEEIDLVREAVGHQGRGGHLDHDAERHVGIERHPLPAEIVADRFDHRLRPAQLGQTAHHRQHHPHLAMRAGAEDAAQLRPEHVLMPQTQPDGPHCGRGWARPGSAKRFAAEVEGG